MTYKTIYVQECENGYIVAIPSTPERQGTQLVAGDRGTMHAAIDVLLDVPEPAKGVVSMPFKGC